MTDHTSPALRLGMTPWHLNATLRADALCQQAELAEQWGYQSFWLPESHFSGAPSVPDPMLLLAAIAARTRTIKLGTSSYLLPIRNPLQAAEQVAVLDQLSGGRLILGLGRGFQAAMLDAFQIQPSEKRNIFEQVLQTMQRAWSGAVVGSQEHGAVLSPLPVQQPHPPIWMAAFGPKALRQAAKLGMPYLASPMESLPQLEKNHRLYRAALDEVGQPTPQHTIVMRTIFLSEDSQLCAHINEQLGSLSNTLGAGGSPLEKSWVVGGPQQVMDEIGQYRERLGMNYLIVIRPRIKGLDPQLCKTSMRRVAEVLGS